jgi:hypothetical protein
VPDRSKAFKENIKDVKELKEKRTESLNSTEAFRNDLAEEPKQKKALVPLPPRTIHMSLNLNSEEDKALEK